MAGFLKDDVFSSGNLAISVFNTDCAAYEMCEKFLTLPSELPEECKSIENLDTAEASRALSQYTAKIIQEGLNNVADQGGDLSQQIALTNQIIRLIQSSTGESVYEAKQVHEPGEQLLALLDEHDPNRAIGKKATDISRPLTSISNSSLFTNSQGEYPLFTELSKEMESTDSIDMLVSFIKWSGLIKILSSLKTFTDRGGKLRVITTSYMGATDPIAVEEPFYWKSRSTTSDNTTI